MWSLWTLFEDRLLFLPWGYIEENSFRRKLKGDSLSPAILELQKRLRDKPTPAYFVPCQLTNLVMWWLWERHSDQNRLQWPKHNTVEPILRDHCHERPPVLKDDSFLAEVPHFNVNEPATKDHLSSETIFLWPKRRSFKIGSTVCHFKTINLGSKISFHKKCDFISHSIIMSCK